MANRQPRAEHVPGLDRRTVIEAGVGGLVLARLPFAAGHTVNRLTHIEALWEPRLHAQVVALLRGDIGLAAA